MIYENNDDDNDDDDCNDDDDDDDIYFGSAGIDMKACKILAQLISILAGCFS